MIRNIQFYKDLEQLNYYIYHDGKFSKPNGWTYIDKYENKKTGFYSEAYQNTQGEVVMIIRGTDWKETEDWNANLELARAIIPKQAEDAYEFYSILSSRYNKIIVSGYSLGASDCVILGNELGLETIAFAPYGVGDFVRPKHPENIINFGNQSDPVFRRKLDSQIGKIYVIPSQENKSSQLLYMGYTQQIEIYDLRKHFPGQIGDISKAVEHTSNEFYGHGKFNLYASYDDYDDRIFEPSNQVIYNDDKKLEEMS